jgi:carbon monoxide dehydrogenase subunit G
MKDLYRFENMTEDELTNAKQMMLNEGILPNHIERIFDSKDAQAAFNKRPPEVRQAFFQKTGSIIDLEDLIDQRLKKAPKAESLDLESIIDKRIANIGQQQQVAVNKEQQILAAAVPQVDVSGRVVSAPAAPAPKRSFIDYLKGTGETVAALGSQAVVAPVAAGAQLASDIQSKVFGGGAQVGQPVFGQVMKAATYEPKTEAGQEMMAGAAKLFEESKLPPVATSAAPPVLPRATKPAVKPRLTYQEFQVQQNVIKGQDPAGLPGVASVGAAGRQNPVAVQAAIDQLPVEIRGRASQMPLKNVNLNALESHVQALNLPEPIQLTKGQATGDLVALSNELNRRAEFPTIARRINEQNNALVENLNLIRKNAAPDAYGTKSSDFGQQVIDGYLNIDRQRNDNIRQLYGQLEQAAGGNFPIDAQKFVQSADQQLKKKLKSEFLPPEIDRQLQSYRDGSSMDFEQFESLRTNLATEIRKAERAGDGNKSFALGVVRDSLENLPLTGEAAKLKPLADAARKAAKERFDALKRDPAYSAAVEGKVAPENFIDTFVLSKGKGTEANVRQMMSALGRGSPEQQAIAAGLMEIITRKAVDSSGNFSQAAYNKILRDLEPKLLEVFDPDSAKQLKNLGEVSRKIMAQPKGSFANNSNTLVAGLAEKFGLAAEMTPILGQSVTAYKTYRAGKAAERFERESLEPLAGAKQERTLGEILRGK